MIFKQEINIKFEFSGVDCVVRNINLYTTDIQFKNSDDKEEEVERIICGNKAARWDNDSEDTTPPTTILTTSTITDYSTDNLTVVHSH